MERKNLKRHHVKIIIVDDEPRIRELGCVVKYVLSRELIASKIKTFKFQKLECHKILILRQMEKLDRKTTSHLEANEKVRV